MKLEQLQIFHNLTEDEMQKSLICSQAVVQKYQKNEYIFRQGDRPEKLYFLLNGDVEVGSINLNGKVTRIGQVTEGEDFGEIELFLHHSAYSGYAKAKNEVKVLEVSKISLEADAEIIVFITAKLFSICFRSLQKKPIKIIIKLRC